MGVVEDIRQVIQDLVAPQLKSLDARFSALEPSVTQRFASAEAVANARHEATTAQIEALREVLTGQISHLASVVVSNHASIQQKLDLDKRVERIETFQAARFELARPVGQRESSNP